jgi:hypothetical protein
MPEGAISSGAVHRTLMRGRAEWRTLRLLAFDRV